jgi:peroxiredoxin
MPIAIGSKAPDFTLKTLTAEGLKDVTLSALLGTKKTLLLFFPAAFTGTCTKEMCGVSGGVGEFAGLNANVLAISVDTPFAQAAWAKENKITVTLLSDLDKKVSAAYDVIFKNLAGIGDTASRASFVLSPSGIVEFVEVTKVPSDMPNFAAISAAIAK